MTSKLEGKRMAAWRGFLAAHATLVEVLERELEEAGLMPLAWYDVLVSLSETPDGYLRMNELAQAVLISRSGLTRLVDRMELAGLLCRQSCPSDRRGSFAVITERGRQRLQQAWPVHARGVLQHFARYLTDEEAAKLDDIFRRIISAEGSRRLPEDGQVCGQAAAEAASA